MPTSFSPASRRLLAAALTGAVVLVPFPLASAWAGRGYADVDALAHGVTSGFVRFWAGGREALGPELSDAVEFWQRFHLVKALLAVGLLAVLVPLITRSWTAYAVAPRWPDRVARGLVGAGETALAALALVIAVANVQGAFAPLTSVLGLLPLRSSAVAPTAASVGDRMTVPTPSGAAATVLSDFTAYHVVMSVLGGLVTLLLAVLLVRAWRRGLRRPVQPRERRRLRLVSVLAIVPLAAFFGIVTAANVSTALRPVPALVAFYAGGA